MSFISLFLFFTTTFPSIVLDVSMIYKHRVDQDFILVNELHAKEIVDARKKVDLRMRNGWKISLEAFFIDDPSQYGPSSKVNLPGILYDIKGEIVKKFKGSQTRTELFRPLSYHYESKEQLIEIIILPKLL